jgi:hypothetical protein
LPALLVSLLISTLPSVFALFTLSVQLTFFYNIDIIDSNDTIIVTNLKEYLPKRPLPSQGLGAVNHHYYSRRRAILLLFTAASIIYIIDTVDIISNIQNIDIIDNTDGIDNIISISISILIITIVIRINISRGQLSPVAHRRPPLSLLLMGDR